MIPELRHPARIGPYAIVRLLGHGGAGTVYLVQQDAPIRRRAALKILRLGMHSPEMFARFEVERRALALLDHPNVARVLDGGTTERTGPYLVMEYVDGEPITKYCDSRRLPVAARLELFAAVCRGIQHAHHRGVLHRDVKPSNVLVTEREGAPVPVVIDFGLARAADEDDPARPALTRHGQPLGTPAYMSPEQLELPSDEVDARTDVYSLGVLLFELVVGVLPHERKFSPYQPEKLLELVRREESTKPSSRFSQLAAEAVEVANARATSREVLLREIRGDLDWIISKALEKDRDRRYATASELGQDVERYVRREPIQARPPSSAYRVERFVARNRLPLGVAAALVFAIILGSAASTFWYLHAGSAWSEKETVAGLCQSVAGDVAEAHLSLEEALAHDTTREVERDVHRPIRASLQRLADARAVLEEVLPAEGEARLDELRAQLLLLDEITGERWENRHDAGRTGGALDQRYDAVYGVVQSLSARIVADLGRSTAEGWRRSAQISIAVNAIALVALACALGFALRIWSRRV